MLLCRNESDLGEIEALCESLQSRIEFLGKTITESLILGYSITKSWKKSLKLLEEVDGSKMNHESEHLSALTP